MNARDEYERRVEALIFKLRSSDLPQEIKQDRDYVIDELETMVAGVRSGKLPPRDRRWPELTRLVVDQWPHGHDLANEVGEVEALFKKL